MNIKGKVAVITGAAGGIGRAVAIELAKRGAGHIALVDKTEAVHALATEISKEIGASTATGYTGDVTDDTFRSWVYEDIREKRGIVQICVPAAGITRDGLSVKYDKQSDRVVIYPIKTYRLVTEINLIAPVYWALEMVAGIADHRRKHGLKRWEPSEGMMGSVIFIGSVASVGNKGQISYSATKAGLEGAASTLTAEAIYHGVRCGVIHPGFTDTPMVRALGEDFIQQNIIPQTQLRRLIMPEEIADAICFMISNAAISGSLWADAGWRPAA
jgi:NAD(P)-dependent dehydrogenase (short-subunit alcohol dehydrogenase family)